MPWTGINNSPGRKFRCAINDKAEHVPLRPLCSNGTKTWEVLSSRRRAYHVLVSDHHMEANIACK